MHNAVVQAQHEIAVRYDFKGTHAGIEYGCSMARHAPT